MLNNVQSFDQCLEKVPLLLCVLETWSVFIDFLYSESEDLTLSVDQLQNSFLFLVITP